MARRGVIAQPSRICARVIAASLFLASCQTTGMPRLPWQEPENLTPAEKQMREEANKFNETVLGGAVVGAIAGAVVLATLCAVADSGGNRRGGSRIGQCAAAGALVGGIMGGVDGYVTAKTQEASAQRVTTAKLMTADLEKDNTQLAGLVESSQKALEASKQRIEDTNRRLAANKMTAEEAKLERDSVERNRDALKGAIDGLKKRRDNYQQAGSRTGANSDAEFTAQMDRLNSQIAQLEASIDGMNEALAISRV